MRYLHNIVSFLFQGFGFAIESFLVMIGFMALWNGYIVEKFTVPSVGIIVAIITTLVIRFLIWLPVFAKHGLSGEVATAIDLGDRPASVQVIQNPSPLPMLTPLTPAPKPPKVVQPPAPPVVTS